MQHHETTGAGEVTDLRLDDAMVRITGLREMHRFPVIEQNQGAVNRLKNDLVRRFLAEFLLVSPERIVIRQDPLGRPTLEPIAGCPRSQQIDFSIAHATGVLAVGVSESARIGVDLEALEEDFDFDAVMQSFFRPAERGEINEMSLSDQLLGFLRAWTAKEACLKAIGHGSAFGLDEIETAGIGSDTPWLRRVRGSKALAAGWKLSTRIVPIGSRAAVLSVVTGASGELDQLPSPTVGNFVETLGHI